MEESLNKWGKMEKISYLLSRTAGRRHAVFSELRFSKLKDKRKLPVVSAISDTQTPISERRKV